MPASARPILPPRMLAMLVEALARVGQQDEARELLHRLDEMSAREYLDPWAYCRVQMALGDHEKAIHFLERSFEERSTLALTAPVDPILKTPSIRSKIPKTNSPPPPPRTPNSQTLSLAKK